MNNKVSTTENIIDVAPVHAISPDSLIERLYFYPAQPGRVGEGGLRTQGKFKQSLPDKPLVSILIAVFNAVSVVEETIRSILEQDYDNIELIVIDGGSTDGTLNVIRQHEYAIDYWISEPDKGISDAFNKAVVLSSGDYLNFQGAGDFIVSEDALSRVIAGLGDKQPMLISARVKRVREDNPTEVIWVAPKRYTPEFSKRSLLFRMSLPHQGLFTHRRMFERYGLFDTGCHYSMDYEHLLRAYHEFPVVIMKDVIFSAWREGGVGTGKIIKILDEYALIKLKNNVAPKPLLKLIDYYIKSKFMLKSFLKIQR